MTECCIIGGGVIGLSIARELAGRGRSVRVLAREGRQDTTSWAAAGILPPAGDDPRAAPHERLTALSGRLHRRWADELRAETGIDTGLRACGGLHVASDGESLVRLRAEADSWRSRSVRCEWLAAADVAACEPGLAGGVARGAIVGGLLLPDESQLRPPRQLEALERSCRLRGVIVEQGAVVERILVEDGAVAGVTARVGGARRRIVAGTWCLAAGAWSGSLADALGVRLGIRPIRGQIALLRLPRQPLALVVNRDLDYLVPRPDGRLLVGSTLEDVGYDRGTTPDAMERLLGMAAELLGDLGAAQLERSWAGLRPGTPDGLPFIGRVPGCRNAFVAAGHFRAGVLQSTGTAVLVADLLEGRPPVIDPTAFAVGRGWPSADRPEAASGGA